ncbi:single-stranded DNA-binding protein [Enterococcus faecalis]|nr:single-stranded DNA-binding protein [Enterococcus faecalis]EGO8163070.1 single-stranded DNA-binding protein [Enterococcus faecalis]
MEREMVNINANLVKEPNFTSFEREGEEVQVVNFTLVKKYGKGKEYINCSAYGEKIEVAKDFEKGDLIHIFGYFKEREYNRKTYKNFVVKSYNKIEKKDNEEISEEE